MINADDWKNLYRGNLSWLPERTILLAVHGSHAYGLSTPESDFDYKGVAVPPARYYHGFANRFEQAESKEPDLVVYEIRKFFELASNCNPNIIEVLFADEGQYLQLSPEGRTLVNNRHLFLSSRAKHTFSGYAMSQLKRINTHYKWLKDPPKERPRREDFDLQESHGGEQHKDQIGAALAMAHREIATWSELDWTSLPEPERIALRGKLAEFMADLSVSKDELFVRACKLASFDDNLIDLLRREKSYRAALAEWESYENWKATRNPKRAELEAQFGYDTKHAMHLVRLMRMAKEIVTEGKVVVKRPDREELLAIRRGAWKYEDLVSWAEKMDSELSEAVKKTSLPRSPDREKLDDLCSEIVERAVAGT